MGWKMSQALYRKYRPKTFDEVYGQSNIVNILKNQIANNKISHAYLFSGTRGTGKTSCAKIFSRAVNCLNPKDGNPCNECANCKAILDESTMDVIEMDAASNRRIDDIRQLRDTVIYPPTDLKYKVYIIDEAHMITNEGFNALLKIMEEPPKHLIFILATTEVDKIPDTILSRTQRFEFKKIDDKVIEKRISDVLKKEEIKMDPLAINSISNIGKGSMRDALSTLDQVISLDKDEFDLEDINDILGIVGLDVKLGIYQSVVNKDVGQVITYVNNEIEKGKDSHNIIKEMIGFIEFLLDNKIKRSRDDIPEGFKKLIDDLSFDYLINSLDILTDYELKIKKSDNRNLLLKMSMIRLLDNTPKDLLISRIKVLEDRISLLEEGGKKFSSTNSIDKKNKSNSKPISVADGNFFEQFKNDIEEETEDKRTSQKQQNLNKKEKSEDEQKLKGQEDFKDQEKHEEIIQKKSERKPEVGESEVEEKPKAQEKTEAPEFGEIQNNQEESKTDESLKNKQTTKNQEEVEVGETSKDQEESKTKDKEKSGHVSEEKKQKSIEHAIRNYVLNKFPSSKQLYDQVLTFSFKKEQLIYKVNEKGYAFSKVMAGLFRQTEEAFYRQTKIKIIIKFELVPSQVEDNGTDGEDKVQELKNFFGNDNLEII